MNKVCFNQNAFLIGIVLLTSIILIFNQFNTCPPCKQETTSNQHEDSHNLLISNRYGLRINPNVDNLIDKRDEGALDDPLKAPNRRLPRHIYPDAAKDYIFEVPTRGYPDNYH